MIRSVDNFRREPHGNEMPVLPTTHAEMRMRLLSLRNERYHDAGRVECARLRLFWANYSCPPFTKKRFPGAGIDTGPSAFGTFVALGGIIVLPGRSWEARTPARRLWPV